MINKDIMNKEKIFLLMKYLFSFALTVLAYTTVRDGKYLLISLLELVVIICIQQLCFFYSKRVGQVFHYISLFIYNIQTAIMYFSGSFLSLVMVTNIAMIRDLQEKFGVYLLVAVPLIVITLIPLKQIVKKEEPLVAAMVVAVILETIAVLAFGATYSPMHGVTQLCGDWNQYRQMNTQVQNVTVSADEFYQDGIEQFFDKPEELPENPNVVLLFIEGVSEEIVYDERDLMPNLRAFEEETLHFKNYYNHTFATFRGLIGQLYSGYQLNNYDTNVLPSMQSIFQQNGYNTTFVNVEPTFEVFTEFLESFQFDNLVNNVDLVPSGEVYIHDKDAFDLLYDTIEAQYETGTPFFTAIYTYGSHVATDSPDEKYGDGSVAILNRFYNVDYQFGEFLKKFKESKLHEDTILIVTSDHATHVDDDYLNAFPDHTRQYPSTYKIPFHIYYKGMTPQTFDANGRNSLSMAPTVFDFLDISASNAFLGESLFSGAASKLGYDTIYNAVPTSLVTSANKIRPLEGDEYYNFSDMLVRYSAVKGDASSESVASDYIETVVSEDCTTITVTLKSREEYQSVQFPVWTYSANDMENQDDLVWYPGEKNEEGDWSCTIDVYQHNDIDAYVIRAYQRDTNPGIAVATVTDVSIPEYPPFHLQTIFNSETKTYRITLRNCGEYESVAFPIWSIDQGQDDIVWYPAVQNEDGSWSCSVPIEDHLTKAEDQLIIHVYGRSSGADKSEFLSERIVKMPKL